MPISIGEVEATLRLRDQMTPLLQQAANTVRSFGTNIQQTIAQASSGFSTLASSSTKSLGDLQVSITQAQAKLNELKKLATESSDKPGFSAGLAAEMDDLIPHIEAMKREFADSKKALTEVTPEVERVGQSLSALGRGATAAGLALSAAITVPLVAIGTASIESAASFESAMTKVVTLAGASKQEVAGLSDSVMKLGVDTAQGPAELAKGLFVVESAGFRGSAAMDILTHSAKMSAIGMGDAEETSRALIGAMLTFQKENLTAAETSDIFVKTVQLGNMKVDELVGALARVNPVAAAFGVKFADVNAAIATFTHLGAPVEVAATGIRAVLQNMLNDSAKTEKGLHALGISMSDLRQEIQDKGLTEALLHLVQTANALPDGLAKLHDVFPNIRALTEVLATAGSQAENYAKITDQIRNANGALGDSFSATAETTAFKWHQLQVQLQELAIGFGDTLLPVAKAVMGVFSDMLPVLQGMISAWAALPEPIRDVALLLAGLLAALGPLLVLFGGAVVALGAVSTAIETLTGTSLVVWLGASLDGTVALGAVILDFATGPVGIAIEAAIALGVALYELYKHSETVRDMIDPLAASVGGAFTQAWNDAKEAVDNLGRITRDVLILAWEDFKTSIDIEVLHQMAAAVKGVATAIDDVRAAAARKISSAGGGDGSFFVGSHDLAMMEQVAVLVPKALGVVAESLDRVAGSAAGHILGVKALGAAWLQVPVITSGVQTALQAAGGATMTLADKVKALTADQREQIASAYAQYHNIKAVAEETQIAADVVGLYISMTKGATSATNEHAKAVADMVHTLDGEKKSFEATFEAARQIIERGPMEEEEARRIVDALDKIHAAHGKIPPDLEAWRLGSEMLGDAYDKVLAKVQKVELTVRAGLTLGDIGASGPKQEIANVKATIKFDNTFATAAAEIPRMIAAAQKKANEGMAAANHVIEKDLIASTRNEIAALQDLAGAFAELGQIAGAYSSSQFVGKLFTGAGQIFNNLQQARQYSTQFQIGSGNYGVASGMFANYNADGSKVTGMQKAGSAVASGAAIYGGAMSVWDATDQSRTAGGNALGGMMAGAQAGAAFGPYGMAVGAAAGLVVGLVRGEPKWAQAADDVGKMFGVEISDSLAKSIADQAKTTFANGAKGGSTQAAEVFNIDKIIGEAGGLDGKNIGLFEDRLRDVFVMIGTNQMSIAQGTQVLDKNWDSFVAAGTNAYGFLDEKLKDIIKLNQQYGTQSQAISKYLQQQGAAAISASNDIIASLSDQMKAWSDLKGKIDADFVNRTADGTLGQPNADAAQMWKDQAEAAVGAKQQLEDFATIAVSTFGAAVAAGMSFSDALQAAGPGLISLRKAFADLGIDIDNTAFASLSFQATLLKNNPALVKGVSGLGSAFAALSNMGLLNVDTFHAMQRSGEAMADELFNKSVAMGGGIKEALEPMQDYLHKAVAAAKALGVPLDENTQRLIDQSKELGIWKDEGKSDTDKMIDGINTLVGRMQALIDKLNGIPRTIDTDINTHYHSDGTPVIPGGHVGKYGYNDDGTADNDGDKSNSYHLGGMVTRMHQGMAAIVAHSGLAQDEVPAILQTGEAVLNRRAASMIGASTISRWNRGGSGGGGSDPALLAHVAALRGEIADLRIHMQVQMPRDMARAVVVAVAQK